MIDRLDNGGVPTLPIYKFKYDRFIGLTVEKTLRDCNYYHSEKRKKGFILVGYQFEELYFKVDDYPWIVDVPIESTFMDICGFSFDHFFTHPAVLYRTYVVWNLVNAFLSSAEKSVVYDDGFGKIVISSMVPGFITIASKFRFEVNVPITKWVTSITDKDVPSEFSAALNFLTTDGFTAQEEMFKRDGNMNNYVFNIYGCMSHDFNPS